MKILKMNTKKFLMVFISCAFFSAGCAGNTNKTGTGGAGLTANGVVEVALSSVSIIADNWAGAQSLGVVPTDAKFAIIVIGGSVGQADPGADNGEAFFNIKIGDTQATSLPIILFYTPVPATAPGFRSSHMVLMPVSGGTLGPSTFPDLRGKQIFAFEDATGGGISLANGAMADVSILGWLR